MKASVALGVVQKEEKVTLPDGTIYQLKTTWTKDAEFRESKSAATQTFLPHGNANSTVSFNMHSRPNNDGPSPGTTYNFKSLIS